MTADTSWLTEIGLATTSAQGLDVSDFQGQFNWAGTAGLNFGTCRVTQGLGGPGTGSPDPELGWNWVQIGKKGLHRGAYHFMNPNLDGAKQAEYFVNTLAAQGLTTEDSLWLDNETAGASPAKTAACAVAFMAELEKLRPHNPIGVYTFIDFAKEGNCAGLSKYALWLAYPSSAAPASPPPWSKWTFWQWGIRNGDDADAFNGDSAALRAWIASFQVPPALAAPGSLKATPVVTLTANLDWSDIRNATAYHAQVTADDAAGTVVWENASLTNSKAQALNLQPSKTYRWRVKAEPNGDWSPYATFTTAA